MKAISKMIVKRIALSLSVFMALVALFTLYVNIRVEQSVGSRIYASVDSVPHNKVALLLGTNPLNRLGRPNTYFTNRIKTAAELYHAGKVDYIIASGDNHTRKYDEPTAMRDSLMAHGVPEDRIILDFAGFRTLDSVVRAKEVFGCDSLTIISQADHCARALYLAEANGIDAVAMAAPLRAGRWVRVRLALREWLARDKMMLDILFGRQPHFLGERIEIPDIAVQKSYSTSEGMDMRIVSPTEFSCPVDSFVVEFVSGRDAEGMTGEWFRIERLDNGVWTELPLDRKLENERGEIWVIFNAIGYPVFAGKPLRLTVKPWFYERDWPSGTYRLAKTYHFSPYVKSDTAYVEFRIR